MIYDLFVVGGGPAGYVAAIRASQLGMKVAIAEEKFWGGTCTNVGCIPTKAWLASSELFDGIKRAKKFGISVENPTIDMKKVSARTNRVVLRSRKGIEFLLKKNSIDFFDSHATIESVHKAKVGDKEVEFKNLLLSQGSHPIKFPPFNVEGILTSDEIFSIDEIPQRLLIVGGGVIGLEMATFFSAFDCKVTIVEIMNHILPNMDTDVAETLTNVLKKRGVDVHVKTKTISVDKKDDGYQVVFEGEERFEEKFDKILLSVGRKSNVLDDVKNLGVNLDKRGNVITDEHMHTNIENIYAAGDVNGKYMLAHVASKEGIVAVTNMVGEEDKINYTAIPSVVFTTPEIATTGESEDELKQKDIDYVKGFFPMSALGRARTLETNEGFAKILADKKGKILGLTVVGPMATEVLMEGVIAVQNGFSIEKLLEHIHPHPTISEIVMQCAEDATGMPIDE